MLASCPPAEAWALAHDYRISASKAGHWMVVGGGGAGGVPALLALIVPFCFLCGTEVSLTGGWSLRRG